MLKSVPQTTVVEVPNEGLVSLLDQPVLIFGLNYIYAGVLEGVNTSCIKLKNPKIVYETGSLTDSKYKDAQALGADAWYIQISAIESFGLGK